MIRSRPSLLAAAAASMALMPMPNKPRDDDENLIAPTQPDRFYDGSSTNTIHRRGRFKRNARRSK